ncbi:MAG: hypothetical protein ACRDP6_44730 [Actinoallomurus sp.]
MSTPIGDIPASSIPAARDWIFAGLRAQLAGRPEVLVCLDGPGTDQPNDIVSVGESIPQTYSPESTVGSGGPGWLREDYTVMVHVECFRGGDVAAEVFAAARALADLVIAVVRSDPSLGGGVQRARPGSISHTAGWSEDHKGRLVEIEIGIDCMNTL